MKEFVGMDWVWRGSVKPDTRDVHFWQPASVPGSVAADLMKNGSMKSPYYNCDSKLGEWISDRTWVYRKEFSAPHLEEKQRVFLCFEGIDYSGEIFLNGESLGTHTGMYLPWRMEITGRLKPGKNLVAAVLEPAPFEQPQVGKTSLVTTHKSRMTYWWDFCPRLIHQGLWDSVYLEVTGQGKIGELHLQQQLSGDFHTAVLSADVETDGGDAVLVTVNPGGISASGKTENGKAKITAKIPHVNLWHPNGYGEPFLYRVTVQLLENGQVSDSRELSYGFRKIEFWKTPALLQMPLIFG